jgi:hypothetical protein
MNPTDIPQFAHWPMLLLSEGAFFLRLAAGDSLQLDDQRLTVVAEGQTDRRFGDQGGRLAWRGRTFHLPPGTQISYPVVPHNPYRQDGLPPTDEYVARLALVLSPTQQVVRIT